MTKDESVQKLTILYKEIKENDLSWRIEDYAHEIEEAIKNPKNVKAQDLKEHIHALEKILSEDGTPEMNTFDD